MPDSPLLLLTTLGAAATAVVLFFSRNSKQQHLRYLDSQIETLRNQLNSIETSKATLATQLEGADRRTRETTISLEELQRLLDEQSLHFPWLANAFAELQHLRFQREENSLRYKKNPAMSAANRVTELKKIVRETELQFRSVKYRIQFYEKLSPWLIELSGEDIDSLIKRKLSESNSSEAGAVDFDEPVRKLLSNQEWQALTDSEKYQLALDRWKVGKKTNWQIGRDFERFVGYELETAGYDVAYHGAIEGLEDLGRDLIAKRSGFTIIVQCKYWATYREVHEKHVFRPLRRV
jgi:hypothetical protein